MRRLHLRLPVVPVTALTASLMAPLLALVGTGCPEEPPPPLELPEGCQPLLGGLDCMMPYPSDWFLVDDAKNASGKRVQMPPSSQLSTLSGRSADINEFMPMDGFSRQPTIVAVLGAAVSPTGLAGIKEPWSTSAGTGARTLILDAETGEAVPHLTDLDARATDPLRQALLLRPHVQLRELHRYVVVLQGIEGPDGKVVPTPEGYRRLRDDVVGSNDAVLSALAARYRDAVFPVLDKAGVDRKATQLAWDFTTGADAWAMGDMLRARKLAMEELERTPPQVTLFSVVQEEEDGRWLKVRGAVTGPKVLEGDDAPGSLLARDESGQVKLNGTTRFDFMAIIPAAVRDSFEPGLAVAYGHGFFGGRGEVEAGSTLANLNATRAVGFAIDWAGMASEDVGVVVGSVGDIVSESLRFGERLPQAMVNWIALTKALQGPMGDAALNDGQMPFRRPTSAGAPGVVEATDAPGVTNAGALLYDPAQIHYFGISQGHILGGTLAALNPDFRHIALQAGGASYTYMMSRASPFKQFLVLIANSMGDPLEVQKLIASYQRGFDRFDPSTYAPYVLDKELPDGPSNNPGAKRLLMQIGLGDAQVPNFAAWLHANMMGLPVVTPSPRAVDGLTEAAAPVDGSGLVIVDMGADESFYEEARPPDQGNPVHEGVRRQPAMQEQLGIFLRTGRIENTCGSGGCVFAP